MGEASDHDEPLGSVFRELRGRFEGEFRAEAEEREWLAAQASRRRRSLADASSELMARGDRVRVLLPGISLQGTIVHVGDDYVAMQTVAGDRVDCHLAAPLALQVIERVRTGGRPAGPGARTLRARLLELELEQVSVEVAAASLGLVESGALVAVGGDHLLLAGAVSEWYVPMHAVCYVRVPLRP